MENLNHEAEEFIERAMREMARRGDDPVHLILTVKHAVSIIAQLQLAFRHPANTGPAREMIEELVRALIERLDPARGHLYRLLMMGFDAQFDQPAEAEQQQQQDLIECRNCRKIVAVVDGRCSNCGEEICLFCGCTTSAACPGCTWTRPNVCSSCDPLGLGVF